MPLNGQARWLQTVFPDLTTKQHEAMRFVAENRSSKEIAAELGISESAVNQRIEGVRARTGGAARAELARAYRGYLGHSRIEVRGLVEAEPRAVEAVEQVEAAVEGPVLPRGSNPHRRMAAMLLIAMGLLLLEVAGLYITHAGAGQG